MAYPGDQPQLYGSAVRQQNEGGNLGELWQERTRLLQENASLEAKHRELLAVLDEQRTRIGDLESDMDTLRTAFKWHTLLLAEQVCNHCRASLRSEPEQHAAAGAAETGASTLLNGTCMPKAFVHRCASIESLQPPVTPDQHKAAAYAGAGADGRPATPGTPSSRNSDGDITMRLVSIPDVETCDIVCARDLASSAACNGPAQRPASDYTAFAMDESTAEVAVAAQEADAEAAAQQDLDCVVEEASVVPLGRHSRTYSAGDVLPSLGGSLGLSYGYMPQTCWVEDEGPLHVEAASRQLQPRAPEQQQGWLIPAVQAQQRSQSAHSAMRRSQTADGGAGPEDLVAGALARYRSAKEGEALPRVRAVELNQQWSVPVVALPEEKKYDPLSGTVIGTLYKLFV